MLCVDNQMQITKQSAQSPPGLDKPIRTEYAFYDLLYIAYS